MAPTSRLVPVRDAQTDKIENRHFNRKAAKDAEMIDLFFLCR